MTQVNTNKIFLLNRIQNVSFNLQETKHTKIKENLHLLSVIKLQLNKWKT